MNNYAALTSTLSREITESATDEGRKSTYSVEQKSFVETGISPTTARNEILTIDSTMDHHFKGMMPLFLNYLHYSILVLPTHVALHIWPWLRRWFDTICARRTTTRVAAWILTVPRYTSPLLFPLLDSYPRSMFDVGSGGATNLAVHAGLTTSTAVASQVRAVEQIVRRLVGIEEREALCDGLQVIAEEYDEGWDSGSDSDGDDE
jgi:hypothetical protein